MPLDGSGVRNIAPHDLTFRFDENQQIDPGTLSGIRIIRAGLDGTFDDDKDGKTEAGEYVQVTPGYIGVGSAAQQNEVIVRFAETLPDDLYRIELYGIDDVLQGISALRNTRGEAFGDLTDDKADNGKNLVVGWQLELAPQVLAVVPQPLTRVPDPADPSKSILQQARNQIVVYFNDDDLFLEDDATGEPTQRSAENTHFYRLIYTQDTVENTDDITFFPDTVAYDPATDSAVLTFASDLETLPIPERYPGDPDAGSPIGPGTWRLRVGTDEALPAPPLTRQPTIQTTSDFGTSGAVSVSFTATGDFGKAVTLNFSRASLGIGAGPRVAVAGNVIQVTLNADGGGTTANELKAALDGNSAARQLIVTTVSGAGTTSIAGTDVASLRVAGLGSSYETAYDLGQLTAQSLLVPSSIDPQPFALDLPGGQDEPGHRDIPAEVGSSFEQHINPNFGRDVQDGVTTIAYNFRRVYGYDAQGNPLSNLITEKQKTRVREAVELWAKHLGIQFLETADQGLTFVTGDPRALDPNDPNVMNHALNVAAGDDYDFIVRIDPSYANGMIILDSARQWNSDYAGDWFQRVMVGLGAMLGLQRANDLPVTNLMAFDSSEPFENLNGDSFSSYYFSNRSDLADSVGNGGFVNFANDGYDSAPTSLFGNRPSEPIFPGNADILHGQYIHRPDSNDIDLYRFTIDLNDQQLDEKKKGLLTAESFAERLPNSSELDTVLSLYREVEIRDANGDIVGYQRELIARNDNYYSSDSYVSLELGSGTYYLGVTAAGNTDFDPVIEDTGYGGTTQGVYELRLNFRSQVDDDDTISDLDRIDENRPGTRLDGDADGTPGGVYNFWFQTRPLDRVLRVTGDGNTYVDGQTLTIEDAFGAVRRFEFDSNGSLMNPTATRIPFSTIVPTTDIDMANQLYNAINSSGLAVTATQAGTAITLKEERVTLLSSTAEGVELAGKTIFVDKTSGTNLRGTLAKPFDNISSAFAAAVAGDIVRIVGNGGFDGDRATLKDNFAYEIGFGASGGPATLPDGSSMSVPQGVTAMIDAGAVFKLRRARIGVGSSSASIDRSAGSLQVLGTPRESVYFTSWMDETIGRDTYAPTTTPVAGDWGGILFKADLDNADARFNYEREGIFLNYVSHADIRYGGGQVRIDNVDQVINPVQMIQMRPTLTYNRITSSAGAAMAADPDSFEETNFLAPQYQLVNQFTPDYERVGPEIHGNVLLQNSINGLFVRITTPAGGELRSLTVPARFDDIDIVHVLTENLIIAGEPGGALLETSRPPLELVTLAPRVGGSLPAGTYTYKLVFVDRNGFEGRPSEATGAVTLGGGNATVQLSGLPPVSGNFVARRLYRSQSGGGGPYNLIAELDAADATYADRGVVQPSPTQSLLNRDPPSVRSVALVQQSHSPTVPGLAPGSYTYRLVIVDGATGESGPASDATAAVTVTTPAPLNVRVVNLTGLPAAGAGQTLRIYRSSVGGGGTYVLAGEIGPGVTDFTDRGVQFLDAAGEPVVLDVRLTGVVRARPDGRLKIDPGTVVKLEGARIEIAFGAQLIAEGLPDRRIIFTSKLDDKYGAGGTFDTNKDDGPNEAAPRRGDWGGIFASPLSQLNLDHAYLAFGGGKDIKIESTFAGFNVIEIHQADARIANSVIEHNALGTGGQGSAHRYGRGVNAGAAIVSGVRYDSGATIFVRGAQPVILNNIIRNNEDVAISINLDSFTNELLSDPGRTTGAIDQVTLYRDNRGPLVRGNRLADNGNQTDVNGNLVRNNNGNLLPDWRGTNGLEIRTAFVWNAGTSADPRDDALRPVGMTLSTESVWDDTDIVHILYDEVRVSNLHVEGGLRLQSSPNESLVVKMFGPGVLNDAYNRNPTIGAGFTATGQPSDTSDRIGGTVYVLGQPGFPVVLTSIHDDTVGAGVQPDGQPQKDTSNNRSRSTPQAGDWRSVRLDQNSHDRNVEIVTELSVPEETAPGLNGIPARAQFLGDLAPDELSGDDHLRLGFEIHGFLNAPADVDYYSFTAVAGTEIWFDIDRTRYGLDTVLELLDANGVLIAQSDNSQAETADADLLYHTGAVPAGGVNPLQKLNDRYQPHHASGLPKDIWGTNPLDAGLRVVLPGAAGARSSYLFRIRSSNRMAGDEAAQLLDPERLDEGLTSGVYRLQVRMREADEVPGSTVRYADIRYAQNGVELIGLPKHSPLLGEAAEDESTDQNRASNDSFDVSTTMPGNRPQGLGNLFATDQATLSVAGALSSSTDIDFYTFDVAYNNISNPSAHHGSLVFDLDYADGLSRANTTMTVFDSSGVPILIARDSNIAEDRPAPVVDPLDQSGMYDLSRGTVGEFDPFLGTVELPQGSYYVAVTSDRVLPAELLNNPAVRLEPINSVIRIAEDRIGTYGGSTAVAPMVPLLFDPAFDGTTGAPANLWHVSNREANTSGHGLTAAFDGSRVFAPTAGRVTEQGPNDTLPSAQSLEGYIWSLSSDPDIGDEFGSTSTSLPHLTVTATGNESFDYYSFVVSNVPARGIFDIDYGATGNPLTDMDSQIFLYDSAGNLLASNNDSPLAFGAGGSASTLDSFLTYPFVKSGTYIIGVAASPSNGLPGGISGTQIGNGDTYTLQVSVENHPAVTTTNSGGATFYFGKEATGSYDLGGAVANGSLVSNGFSLKNYSAQDLPVLYFNYRLDADSGDYFRVYVQRTDGTERLVASSNPLDVTGAVVRLTNDNLWRQARVELAAFAGADLLKLRYEFQAANGVVSGGQAGVHIDDVIIGFAERGEMITEAQANPTFSVRPNYNTTGRVLSGAYQLEMRRATDYGTSVEARVGFQTVSALILNETYDTNDRQAQQMTILVPAGSMLSDGQTFRLGDGAGDLTFEFDSNGVIQPGNVRLAFRATDPDYVVAATIRDAINSPSVQSQLDLQAALSDGAKQGSAGRANRIDLFGNAVGDFVISSADTVLRVEKSGATDAADFGNLLRDRILGTGFTPTGGAAFVGGVDASDGTFTSAGLFTGGLSSIGIESGVILSTGKATVAAGPNTSNASSGDASLLGDADLDNEFFPSEPAARKTKDATALQFPVQAGFDGPAYFNFVFASEEYNELARTTAPADALAVFVTDLTAGGTARNVALVPGTSLGVSRNTVNGGNPYGSGATNPQFYNNNDLREGGAFLRELGYDGFTDVFTAQFDVVAGHEYLIKFAIADAGDTLVDSAVFIEAGSLGNVNPAPVPVGLVGVLHDGFGDANHFRDQGQILIHSNTITNAADFAIVADAGLRDIDDRDSAGFGSSGGTPRLGQSHIGPARNLLELNNRTGTGAAGGMAPGATIFNNTIYGEGLGGIHFSGDLRPYELVPRDNAGGDPVCDGDVFSVTVGRTTVEFEFEDLSDHGTVGACPANSMHGDGWTPGRVPIYYLMESETPITYNISTQRDLANAIADAITRSILVDNGTTLVAEANVGLSRSVGGSYAAYVDHARDVTVLSGDNNHSPFATTPRVTPIGQAAQPFGRIVNNTIVGNDGNAGFFPDPVSEPNDTIFNAVDTRQGRQASPEMFVANNVRLGDSSSFLQNPAWDVDFYQFQMDIGDHVQITITGNEFLPQWRLFNERGEEFVADGSGTAQGVPRVTASTTVPNQYTIDFYVADPPAARPGYNYAREGGTYFVAVSGHGNDSYSPLSLGSRQTPSAVGNYSIRVNVLAPRRWVIDTQPLFGQSVTWEVTDVDGTTTTVSYTGTSDRRANTPVMAYELREQFQSLALRGITAEDFGGPEYPYYNGIYNYTPYPSSPRSQWRGGYGQRNQGDGRRYVVVYGAAKIVQTAGPANVLSPVVNQNNVDSQVLRETGVLISEEATPTLLNNVFSNLRNAVVETENQPQSHQTTGVSPRTAIVGSQIFQHSEPFNGSQSTAQMGNWSYSLGRNQTGSLINPEELLVTRPDDADFNLPLSNTAPLFENAGARNFFLAPLTAAIDSSVDALEDRPLFITVKAAMGLANSPILAPARDATGQLRVDDPNVSPPQGQGGDLFKDRGSLDRSDFIGPAAVLLNPRDDDADGNDIDPTGTVVQLTGGSYDSFLIQIVDGFELSDPYPGVGVNDQTVLGPNGPEGRLPGAAVTVFADGVFLEEGIDYTYRYDATRNTIRLSPTSGVWEDGKVYIIRLNNRDRYVISAPDGAQALDAGSFRITGDDGVSITFEYDNGFTLQVPNSLALQVPLSGVADGQRFVVRNAGSPSNLPVTFELDRNNYVLPGNIPVTFALGDTQDQIAAAIAAALNGSQAQAAGLQLQAKNVGGGLVHLGAPEYYTLNTELSTLGQPATIMSLAVPAVTANPTIADVYDGQTFRITYTPPVGAPTTVSFEFDTDTFPNFNPANRRVAIPANASPTQVADQIVTVLGTTPLAGLLVGLQHVGSGLIHIHDGDEVTIDPGTSKLSDGYVSRPLADDPVAPQVFVVSYDQDANSATPPIQVNFELDREGTSQAGNVVIPYSYGDTHQEIGQKIAAAVTAQISLDLSDSKHLENGVVFLGGTIHHKVDLSGSSGLVLLSQPYVTPTTRLILPAPLTMTVDPRGGAAIVDGEYFQIIDTSLPPADQVLQFEFTSAGGANQAGTDQLIVYSVLDSADTIAQYIVDAINALLLPGYDAGQVLQPVATPGGVVTLTGANSYHSLNANFAPRLTASGGRLADGETFAITYSGVTRVFEYDVNGRLASSSNLPILFTPTSNNDEIGASTVAAIKSQPLLGLPGVEYVGQGIIEFHDTSRHVTVLPADAIPLANSLQLDGIPGGAVRLPFEPWSQFTGAMFAEMIVDAINASPLTNVTASLRGGNTLFVDFLTAANKPADFVSGQANITGISNYFLRAIQDQPGNFLKSNQYTGETRFTILLPGADLDFGDARVEGRPSQYPTLFTEDGARHVVTADWYLGDRVDGERQAQIVPAGFGDDLDHLVDLRDSTLQLKGSAPLTVQLPKTHSETALDATYFDLGSGVVTDRFVFDRGRNGITDPARNDTGVRVWAVPYDAGATLPQIAEALVAAVTAANIGLTPAHLGAGTVFLGGTQLHRIDTTSSHVAIAGQPTYQITAAAGYLIRDGETLTISDGKDVVPWVFEFDLNGVVAAGHFVIPLLPSYDSVRVAQEIKQAVAAAQRPAPAVHQPAVTLTDLGDGALHVFGALSHEINFRTSPLTYAAQTPVTLAVPAAGLGFKLTPSLTILVKKEAGGGVADGETFTLHDGAKTVVFEFETGGGLTHPGARPVTVNALSSGPEVAEAIRSAIQLAVNQGAISGLTPTVTSDPAYPDHVVINLGAGIVHGLDASASGLLQLTAVSDGQTFEVNDGTNAVTFEFDFDGSAAGVGVSVSLASSANEIANAMVKAIQESLDDPALGTLSDAVGLRPKNLGAGNIQVGGPGSVDASGTPALTGFGSSGGVLDGHTFHLIDSLEVRRFEFDADGQATQGNLTISFQVTSTAADIAAAAVAVIRESGYGVNVVHFLDPLGAAKIALDGDDEDGIRFGRVFTPGSTVPITVTASQDGYLDGWVDFNGDGDWNDPLERVFTRASVRGGVNTVDAKTGLPLEIHVPNIGPIVTYARFRYGSEGGLAPTGLAIDGEVEDYRIEIVSNDPPTITPPAQLVTLEDQPLTISGLRVGDPDAALATIEVTLSVLHGQLTVWPTYLPGGITGNGSDRVVLRGSLTQINNTLADPNGLTYLNDPVHYSGGDSLTVVVDDLGNSGTGGPQQTVVFIPISVLPVNDPPVIHVPGTEGAIEDKPWQINGISITDVEIDKIVEGGPGTNQVLVTLTAGRGTLDVDTTQAASVTVTGDGGVLVTLQGDLQGVNAILAAGVTYQGSSNLNGQDVIIVSADDLGNWPTLAQTSSVTVTVTVAAVNDAPVLTVPASPPRANEDTELLLSGFDVVDVDSADEDITVTLTVSDGSDWLPENGIVTVRQVVGGVDPSAVAGNGTSQVTITAPVAEIAATLRSGLFYTPPVNFAGNASAEKYEILTLTAKDGGFTGDESPPVEKSDTETVTVYVNEVNDPPVVTPPTTAVTITEDESRLFGAIVITDAEASAAWRGEMKLTVGHGTLTLPRETTSHVVALPNLTDTGVDGRSANGTGSVAPDGGEGGSFDEILAVNGAGLSLNASGKLIHTRADVSASWRLAQQAGGLMIDLGAVYTIDVIQIWNYAVAGWEQYGPSTFDLWVSATGSVLPTGTLAMRQVLDNQPLNRASDVDGDGYKGETYLLSGNTSVPAALSEIGDEDGSVTNLSATSVSARFLFFGDLQGAAGAGRVGLSELRFYGRQVGAGGLVFMAGDGVDDASITFRGSLGALNATSNGITYTPNLNYNSWDQTATPPRLVPDVFTIAVNDLGNSGGAPETGQAQISITVTPINDAPAVFLPGDLLSVTEDTDLRLAVSITDPDVTEAGSDGVITVTLDVTPIAPDTQYGTLTVVAPVGTNLNVTGNSTAHVVVRGTLTDINRMLADSNGLKYRGDANASGKVLFSVKADDEAKWPGPRQETTRSMTITAVPVNDAPVITVPSGTRVASEDTPTTIYGVSIYDVEIWQGVGDGQMTVTLSAARGTIDLSDTWPSGVTVTDDASQFVTVSGPLTGINSLLASGIIYRGLQDLNGPDTVTVTANDRGNWPPLAQSSSASFTVSVTAVNDPPVVSAPSEAQVLNEDTPYVFPLIAIRDVDVAEGTNELKVDLRVVHGTLTLDLAVPGGLRAANVSGNGTSQIVIDKAGPSQINATLSAVSGLTYLPTLNYNGADTLTIVADDKGNTGGVVAPTTATVPITIRAVNDAPQLPWTVPPAPQTNEDIAAYIKWAASPSPVADVDANEPPGDGKLRVTLEAGRGTLTVSTGFGLKLGDFIGSNSGSTVIFEAPLAAINATMSAGTGILYLPNLNYNGKDTVVVTVNDRGNSDAGLANPLTATGTVTVTIAAVNDAPVLTVGGLSVDVDEDTNLPLQVQISDADAAEGTGELEMTLQVFFGTLTVNTAVPGGLGVGNVMGNGTVMVSLVGTQQQLNATFAANGVVYRGNPNFFTTTPGEETLLIHAEDEISGVINTGPLKGVDNKTVTINVRPVNDAPTIQIVPPAQITEDTPVALPIIVNDAEMNVPIGSNVIWTVRLDADLGTFTVLAGLSGGVPAGGIAGNGSGHVVLTGTGQQIQTTLAATNGVTFQGVKDFAGTDILTVTVNDPGPASGPSDPQTSAATLTYTISGVNDAPQITLPAGLTTPEDVALALTGPQPQGVSVDDPDSGTANISVVLQVTNGKLTVGGTVPAGLNVAGSGTNKVTLVGRKADIATLLEEPNGIKYTGNLNYFGSDTLVVSADDRGNSGAGGVKTDSRTAVISVTPVNDPPIVAKPVANFSVDEDAPDTLIELFPGVFTDPDDTTLALNFDVQNDPPGLLAASISQTRLTLDYLPNQNGKATIVLSAADRDNSVSTTFTVTVRAVADPPYVAHPIPDQTVALGSTTTVVVPLAGVFSDPDNDALTLSYNPAADNTNPTLVTGGSLSGQTLTLQLGAGRFGRAEITVHATDPTSRSVADTFAVIVDSRPTANPDTATTKEDTAVAISVVSNDRDTDGAINPASVTLVAGSGPTSGQIVSIANGVVTYRPNGNFAGTDTFQYTVQDNSGLVSLPATVTITVQAVPDYQNPLLAADVNRDGKVSPIDALIDINYINGPTGGVLPPDPVPPATPIYYYDVNGNGLCDPGDVLSIVNILNAAASAGGEGENAPTSVALPAAPLATADLAAALLAVPDYTWLAQATGDAALAVPAGRSRASTAERRTESVPGAAESSLGTSRRDQDAWFQRLGTESSKLTDAAWSDALDDFAQAVEEGFGDMLAADLVLSGLKPRA